MMVLVALACTCSLSHGFKTESKKVSATALFWESHQYGLTEVRSVQRLLVNECRLTTGYDVSRRATWTTTRSRR